MIQHLEFQFVLWMDKDFQLAMPPNHSVCNHCVVQLLMELVRYMPEKIWPVHYQNTSCFWDQSLHLILNQVHIILTQLNILIISLTALNELDEEVHKYQGREPSGRMKNEIALDHNRKSIFSLLQFIITISIVSLKIFLIRICWLIYVANKF